MKTVPSTRHDLSRFCCWLPHFDEFREQPSDSPDERLTQRPTEPQVCIQIPLEPLEDLQRHRPLHLDLGWAYDGAYSRGFFSCSSHASWRAKNSAQNLRAVPDEGFPFVESGLRADDTPQNVQNGNDRALALQGWP